MLDIIVPVYKAKKTLLKLLMSIAVQKNVSNFKVYLVVDCDDEDYSYEVDFISKYYPIEIFYLDKNVGPGKARQYGIDHSNNPYIMFCDSDDYLYNPYSLYFLMKQIDNFEFDWLISNFRYERDNEVVIKNNDFTWLHGKVYKREFLDNNNIYFNDTRSNEDNGFNCLVLFSNPRIYKLDSITYVYSENFDSITRRDNRLYKFTGLEYFTYNINWAVKEATNNDTNINYNMISKILYITLVSMYFYYLDLYDKYDNSKILKWTKDTLNLSKEYEKYLSDTEKEEIINNKKKENIGVEESITFEEFIEKVSDYSD